MKITTNLEKEFRPITMNITFESLDELRSLWHRLNVPKAVVEENLHRAIPYKDYDTLLIWNDIDEILKEIDPKYER